MVKMGAREFVYPNFGYRSRWLRNRDPVYCPPPDAIHATKAAATRYVVIELISQ